MGRGGIRVIGRGKQEMGVCERRRTWFGFKAIQVNAKALGVPMVQSGRLIERVNMGMKEECMEQEKEGGP